MSMNPAFDHEGTQRSLNYIMAAETARRIVRRWRLVRALAVVGGVAIIIANYAVMGTVNGIALLGLVAIVAGFYFPARGMKKPLAVLDKARAQGWTPEPKRSK